VGQARYLTKLSLENGFTHFQYIKLKICIYVWKEANLTPQINIWSTVTLQIWDLCHLKDNMLSYSQQLESSNLHILIIFYEFLNPAETFQFIKQIGEQKKSSWAAGNGSSWSEPGWPSSTSRSAGEGIQMHWRVGPTCQQMSQQGKVNPAPDRDPTA
jgi:hypothetical protein